ncbi:uncharacterized protein LOC135848288 [Planococcus citri]|uniref:uncharacterized protein LOC135848288 n=1 Tax=Planococcus citri TaxID=170843 RepID=UPI0031F8B4DA
MAEINSGVYDIFHPSPVSLKDLSAIAVSQEIWRCQVIKICSCDDTLEEFDPAVENISLETVLPDLPSTIRDLIDKYVTKFGFSLSYWLQSHHDRVFYFHYGQHNRVLKHFKAFVCDCSGLIHYIRTAERMMRCNRFDAHRKFIIACTYFFEDDIRRLWPLVLNEMNLSFFHFSKSPHLYYWICCLKNELDKIPTSRWDNCVDEVMLTKTMTHNRPSVEYFWNRIPTESRIRKACSIFQSDVQSFVRYILPKLNDQQLDKFVNESSFDLMRSLCQNAWYDKDFILSTWMQIRDIIKESTFTNEVTNVLQSENRDIMLFRSNNIFINYNDQDDCFRKNWFDLCCEMWNSAPQMLKRSAIEEITSNNNLFVSLPEWDLDYKPPPQPKDFKFLSTFLSSATYEKRRTFWSDCWKHLIKGTRCRDFQKIMNLCFESEDEIIQFKENVMANSEEFLQICDSFLRELHVDELNEFVSLSRPEIQAARIFKQNLLQSVFFGQRPEFSQKIIARSTEFNDFINEAYNDTDLSLQFKNQLISSSLVQKMLTQTALLVPIEKFAEFMDAFVTNEQSLQQIKKRIVNELGDEVGCGVVFLSAVSSLASWCLEDEEQASQFMMNLMNYE